MRLARANEGKSMLFAFDNVNPVTGKEVDLSERFRAAISNSGNNLRSLFGGAAATQNFSLDEHNTESVNNMNSLGDNSE